MPTDKGIITALNYIVLGTAVVTALYGATNLAVAGIAIYLAANLKGI